MRHVGEERALRAVGAFGVLLRLAQLFFNELLRGDVARDAVERFDLPFFIDDAQLGDFDMSHGAVVVGERRRVVALRFSFARRRGQSRLQPLRDFRRRHAEESRRRIAHERHFAVLIASVDEVGAERFDEALVFLFLIDDLPLLPIHFRDQENENCPHEREQCQYGERDDRQLAPDVAAQLNEEAIGNAERGDADQLECLRIVKRDFGAESPFIAGAATQIERSFLRLYDVVVDLQFDASEERRLRLRVLQQQQLVECGDDVAHARRSFAAADRADDRVRLRARHHLRLRDRFGLQSRTQHGDPVEGHHAGERRGEEEEDGGDDEDRFLHRGVSLSRPLPQRPRAAKAAFRMSASPTGAAEGSGTHK